MSGTGLHRGDWVEILSLADILGTLDAQGRLDGLPFMPEMTRWCGTRQRVAATADRICSEDDGRMRRLPGAVLLEGLRCDGVGHDGCQRGCAIFWRTAWLRKPGRRVRQADSTSSPAVGWEARLPTRQGDRYMCQSTELRAASQPYSRWDPRQYVADPLAGNVGLAALLRSVVRVLTRRLGRRGRVLASPAAPTGSGAPTARCLQPGARVRVLDAPTIVASLDARGRHRGLSFESDMLTHCGGQYRVERRIDRIILETSGQMQQLRDTVALEGVSCRRCVRASALYWREVWLEPQPSATSATNTGVRLSER